MTSRCGSLAAFEGPKKLRRLATTSKRSPQLPVALANVNSRPLEFFERIMHVGNRHSAFLMARVLLLEGAVDATLLERALQSVHRRVPILQATIATGSRGPELIGLPPQPPPILRRVERTDDATWQQIAVDEVHERFAEGTTLWRATLVSAPAHRRSELVVTIHHSICDGTSATWLMQWTLEAYRALATGRDAEGALPSAAGGLRPPVSKTPLGALASTIAIGWNQLQQAWWGRRTARLCESVDMKTMADRRRTIPVFLQFDESITAALVRRTRDMGVKMHGTLSAAMLLTARRHADDSPSPITCVTNIDLRRHSGRRRSRRPTDRAQATIVPSGANAAPSRDENATGFGCGAYFVVTRHDNIDDGKADSFWETARDASARLWRKLDTAHTTLPYRWVGALAAAAVDKAIEAPGAGRTQTIGVSNLGPVDLGPARNDSSDDEQSATAGSRGTSEVSDQNGARAAAVRGMYSLTGQHGIGPDVTLIAATVDGRLHATLCFVDPLINAERRQLFANEFRERLERAARLDA